MTKYVLRLFLASGRWFPPALSWCLYNLVNLTSGSIDAGADAATAVPGSVVTAAWLVFNMHTFDGREHSDLLAAVIGSPVRMRVRRTTTSAFFMFGGAVVMGLAQATRVGFDGGLWLLLSLSASIALGGSAAALAMPIIHRQVLARLLTLLTAVGLFYVPIERDWMSSVGQRELGGMASLWAWALLAVCGSQLVTRMLLPRRLLNYAE